MAASTSSLDGRIAWREVMCRDVDATVAFYSQLLGWTVAEHPMEGGAYRIFQAGPTQVAGLLPLGPGMEGAPPCWMAYVKVADVATTADRVRRAGGQVLAGPMQIPGWGSFLVMQDPQGGVLNACDFAGEEPGPPGPGEFCWETLSTPDVGGAVAYYRAVLGWTVSEMGGAPILMAGEAQVANVSPTPSGVPASWSSYVLVTDLAATRDRVPALGGSILQPEVGVPGVGRLALVSSPEGAVFTLFQAEARG